MTRLTAAHRVRGGRRVPRLLRRAHRRRPTPVRRRRRRAADGVRRQGGRRRARPGGGARHGHRRARPQRRRQDHHAGDLRGLPAAAARARSGCSGSTRRRERRDLLPRIGVMLQSGGAWSGVRAVEMLRHIAALHAHPLDVGDAGRAARPRRRAGARRTGGSPAASSSGSRWRWRVVGRPELVFVDEPTAGMDPQARRDTWELLEELRADGVTVVLTTHYMDEAERLADHVHVIDHGRLIASGTPFELTRGTGTARSGWSSPSRSRPARRPRCRRALGRRHRRPAGQRAQPADHRPGRRVARSATVSAVVRGARRAARVADAGPAHPGGRLPGADRTGAVGMTARDARRPRHLHARARRRTAGRGWSPRRPGWRPGCCCATASSCCWPS